MPQQTANHTCFTPTPMSSFTNMDVLAIGASRNIGYLTSLRLLEKGAVVTFMLRSPSIFDEDEKMQHYIRSGRARLVQGDALKEEDVRRAWEAAGVVDTLLFTVGFSGNPGFSFTKGFLQDPPNLVSACFLNVICTMPAYAEQPKIIVLSSTGLSPVAHKTLPLPMRLLYNTIEQPHQDKLAMERVIAHGAGWRWGVDGTVEPDASLIGENWQQRPGLPAEGSYKNVLVVRAAWLTDGKSLADEREAKGKPGYRYSEQELRCYTISRADVAHFIVTSLGRWDEVQGKRINVGY
ncbi:NAD(P)-bd-dom domain-containing protein [Mycena chlorophos]|uniref:NAD(P)-bd-dom domain-containing protein n=1 Tax=Mycena chlorophos TaxID=658473 RepID=A0A8H6SNJ7_MYCCL|nr:NAD(P)-bd-dom domain-containing protein [Mycena chlorophos]